MASAETCIFCGSDQLEGGPVTTGERIAYNWYASQEMWCLGCNSGWTDVYRWIGRADAYQEAANG